MKRKLKMPRLSRKGRVVRNLLVCLALLAVLWARYGHCYARDISKFFNFWEYVRNY